MTAPVGSSGEPLAGRVSVVLAAHNEAPVVAGVIAAILAIVPAPFEVIVIDDGSSDDTAARARAAGALVYSFARNRGKGAAVRHGLTLARGEWVVLLDADGQDDPAEIPRLLAARGAGVDLVIGSRFLGSFDDRAITRLNRLGTVGLTRILNALFHTQVTDCLAGFRVVRRRALERFELQATRYDIEVDLLIGLLQTGGHVVEVPVRRAARFHGKSGLTALVDGPRILWRILARRVRGPERRPAAA